ncbi:putative aromatic amino acid family biosynthesis-related protein [Cutaneotrichosporon oleaginosum]|uniref:Pentafunctional AROM polypeptide n=1 Tax=Cutaneotrichosporon oleaginosum TaxID=879819 RepID=A0A0J1B6L5_9TREE|nr:putative aromatic amino acid family biosynthesis-related protein [Cutaneotrichosporon oleaginosum]KLT43369.1 putative aromatic amino acid family biosynthesis-related protein [Cutaneotrichosporon oleaginosum]TXT05415.1 hypothetical protein COLE_06735 [Cutaneotrichosporon oleaginosum]
MSDLADVLKISILGNESIHVGFHLLPYIFRTILTTLPSSTYALITDTNLARLYLPALQDAYETAAKEAGAKSRFLTYQVAPGETAKSREVKGEIEDWLLDQKCTRDTVILAFGGGVIGDLTGFVAATFMRGVKFVQIPTTLLAMVDSAVGGKTAIDTPHGKNLIGAFWQPSYIFVDLSFLSTLNQREFSNGMAEVVKTAAIWKADDFALLESRAEEISSAVSTKADGHAGRFAKDRSVPQTLLLTVVCGSIYVKAHIVTIDERETGLRNLVNFGHSVGHAIEAVLTPTILHGECVSIGMILEAEIARHMGVLSQVAVGRLTRALKAYGLPVTVHDPRIAKLPASTQLTVDRLIDIMRIDKKNSGDQKKIVILSRIGKTYEEKATVVPDVIIRKVLAEAVVVKAGVPTKSPVTMATPGSKSISNRALVLAALGKGMCRIKNLLHSDDTAVMMNALSELKGAEFSWEDGGETIVVEGGAGNLTPPPKGKELYLGNAGTAARFLTTVCAIAQTGNDKQTVITGNARMKQRPIGPLVDALRENGTEITYNEAEGCLPLDIGADGLRGGHIKLAASVSSQYVSSILLCAPYAKEAVTLELIGGQVISQLYIDMTIAMMAEFGVNVERKKDASGKLLDVYVIPKAVYINPAEYNVESDASSATYPLAIAAITGTTCTIPNIGSSSLQGDARFAKEVLEPMGCTVEQTATSTKVTGPPIGQLRALGNVDMEPMTDAFLTASVLAAVATLPPLPGREVEGLRPEGSRIYGIANQRVKECNRIKAMRDELAKFGVETDEFADGIIVYGKKYDSLKTGVSVHCYDDHRVAMAHAVLACVVDGTILEEKRCVEKTWPNFWDDLQTKIGIEFDGVELDSQAQASTSGTSPMEHPVLLIGMRGAGKTYIGQIAAETLAGEYTDADDVFIETTGQHVSEFVAEHGWPKFRETETTILSKFLREKRGNHVIGLGGGVVESVAARKMLQNHIADGGVVVHVTRDLEELEAYLDQIGGTQQRPKWGEDFASVFRRREPWYHECSSHEFVNIINPVADMTLDQHHRAMRAECSRFFKFITGRNNNRVEVSGPNAKPSAFLSLTFPDVTPALANMDVLTEGADAIELRIDLLTVDGKPPTKPQLPPAAYVAKQLAHMRLVSSLPVVFAVRSKDQGGWAPSDDAAGYETLVRQGCRMGAEYVDVELAWPADTISRIVAGKRDSALIASWHDWTGDMKWDGPEVAAKYADGSRFAEVVKIVGTAKSQADNAALAIFAERKRRAGGVPLLAINMGAMGQLSRVLNPVLTPITHSALPSRAAPGQLTAQEVMQARSLIGLLPSRKFWLFGSPIAASVSPTLHNTGFKVLGFPHEYGRCEAATITDAVKQALADPDFGGASVTIPLKLEIMPLLSEVSEHARTIGAVNTAVVRTGADGQRELHGDNTDWMAIEEAARANLNPALAAGKEGLTTLVIGAGGTCRAAIYALHALGSRCILLFNRTRANAEKVAASFPASYGLVVVDDLASLPAPPAVVVSTVPGASLSTTPGEGIFLPPSVLAARGGVAIDMAYKPHKTALLCAAEEAGWAAVTGIEILCLQGFRQFTLWTGKPAPKHAMRKAAMEQYFSS